MIVFGPVPSRRFGRSMGINNIPPKICSYSCIYCQIGRTLRIEVERKEFYSPNRIYDELMKKMGEMLKEREKVDFLTFVPDGEPTLDINLGKEIEMLKQTGIKIAVITNSSLLWKEDVRKDLAKADAVSIKIDTVDKGTWRKMNRPHPSLSLHAILEGINEFAKEYEGTFLTETMLVKGINDDRENIKNVAEFISGISPHKGYISIPTRPPAEPWVLPPDETLINEAYHIFAEKMDNVKLLTGYEGNEFFSSGDVEEDLLSITSVHPMREDAVKEFLGKRGADWHVMERLMSGGKIVETFYRGRRFYLRKIRGKDEWSADSIPSQDGD